MGHLRYNPTHDDGTCIFCNTDQDESISKRTFWQDKYHVAFLSGWPTTPGYAVIIPKKHYGSDILAMPDKALQRFTLAAKKVSNILTNYYKDVGRVAAIMEGMGVDHAHFKMYPMHGTTYLKKGKWKQFQSGKSEFFDKYPGYISSRSGPRVPDKKLFALAKRIKASMK
jgi:diadenosine tetraphosphate (Ap4A) HIT family hydrolase